MIVRSKVVSIAPSVSSEDPLTRLCRDGAQKMLQVAIEQEVGAYIDQHSLLRDAEGHRLVVRNGHMPERQILTGVGSISVTQPRVNDKRVDEAGDKVRFHSSILPSYLRKSKSIEELIPWLYLKGVSTGDFSDALASLVGSDAAGLSATTVTRLKAHWLSEYHEWCRRSLKGKRYIYIWVDGIYSRIRLGDGDKQCLLVVMGVTESGAKELVAVEDGIRESEISWTTLLLGLKKRGLEFSPQLTIGDGALGFWAAIEKVFPEAKHQRCWVHKTANILDKLPKSLQAKAKKAIHEIWMAETKKDAERAFDHFIETYGGKYPKAADCLSKDRDALLAFYDFPAEHWSHIRTTNPIESTFATIRLRTKRTKGHGSADAALSMMFKLAQSASKKWKRLRGRELLADVIDITVRFVDGIKVAA
jgi:transposase-like protein